MRPVITLTTDLGTVDGYVGAIKGVLLSICRDACLVDITHSIPSQDVRRAALTLWQTARCFPAGTVHLMVVDPGNPRLTAHASNHTTGPSSSSMNAQTFALYQTAAGLSSPDFGNRII